MNKKYMALGRMELKEYLPYIKVPTLILSIHSYLDSEPKFLKDKIKNVVHVEFFEFNDESSSLPVLHAMTQKDAANMVATVKKYFDKVQQIIVHCDAGQSRSVGCIAAIKKWYTVDDDEFFRGTPNMYCYHLLLEEFYRQEIRDNEK